MGACLTMKPEEETEGVAGLLCLGEKEANDLRIGVVGKGVGWGEWTFMMSVIYR